MLNYLRESLHWIHLFFFKPMTLGKETEKFTRKQAVITFLKVYPVAAAIYLLLLLITGAGAELAGYSFVWNEALPILFFGLEKGLAEAINYVLAFLPIFFFTYFRPFYLLPYAWQYWRARIASDPFPIFRNSPVYWDEVIATPLPYLKDSDPAGFCGWG